MSYEDNIPEFALRPAKEPEETGDGFDPTPYDRLLYGEEKDTSPSAEEGARFPREKVCSQGLIGFVNSRCTSEFVQQALAI